MKLLKKQNIITILFYVTIFLFLVSTILVQELADLDEIWNYNMAKNIADGRIPYVEFNTIVTPLLPIICSIFLKIFGNQLIVMRMLEVFLQLAILIITFLILKRLKIKTRVAEGIIGVFILLTYKYMAIDYNYAVLAMNLIIIYLELKYNEIDITKTNIKKDIIVGILAGSCICTKQTIGTLIAIALIVYKIILIKDKITLKEIAKSMLYKVIGICIPIIILSTYFTVNGMWQEFISYCIIGIKEFSNNIPYNKLLRNQIPIKILAVISPITLVYMLSIYFKTRKKESKYNCNIFTITPFAVAEIITIYPIADEIHFLIGIYPTLICLAYVIYTLTEKLIKKHLKLKIFLDNFIKMIIHLLIIITIIYSTSKIYKYLNTYKSQLNHFQQIPITNLEEKIKEIDEYIKNQNQPVYILDAEAAIYQIPLDKYNKNYDMFMKGNLGAEGEEGQIQQIKNQQKGIYLIKNSKYQRNWQSPERIIKYVQTNLEKTGEINIYDIYEK